MAAARADTSSPLAGVRAILFDLDGTLLLADRDAPARLAQRLAAMQKLITAKEIERWLRRLLVVSELPSNYALAFWERLGVDLGSGRLADALRRWKGVGTPSQSQLLPGTVELLRALRERYRLAVVTARSRKATLHFLREHRLAELLDCVTTRQETWLLKPHPAPVRYTARQLGLPTAACLMVGDTSMDIRSAKSAGALAAGVLTGFGEEEELRRAGADLILERATDLLRVLPGSL